MLSEDVKALRTWLDMQRSDSGGPVTVSPEGVDCIIEALNSLIRLSTEMEALGAGRKTPLTSAHPGRKNVILFPVVPRPVPRSPEGGAA